MRNLFCFKIFGGLSSTIFGLLLIWMGYNVSLIEFNDQELCWGYSELYPVKYGYEFHCQFAEYGSNDRYDLILCCKDRKTVYSINI